jgi:3D (Asp-Asp-Asp) domain-containing protein
MSQVVKLKRFVLVEASLLLVVTLAAILKPPAVETVIKRDVVTITKEVKVPVERQVVLGAVESLIDNPVIQVIATAYDLSYDSCNKARTDRAFGITSRGVNLKGKDWRTARVIAVDPKVIPLDSKVRVTFLDPKYAKYNGIYLDKILFNDEVKSV